MKIYELPKWVMFAGYGLTIGQLVFIRKGGDYDKAYVTAHEFCHTLQFRKYGSFRFPFMYIAELFRNGYHNNKYEIEARAYGSTHKDMFRDD